MRHSAVLDGHTMGALASFSAGRFKQGEEYLRKGQALCAKHSLYEQLYFYWSAVTMSCTKRMDGFIVDFAQALMQPGIVSPAKAFYVMACEVM